MNIDLAPTARELAALTASDRMQGRSLVSLLRNPKTTWREVFIYEALESYGGTQPMLAAMTAEWNLIQTWETTADVGQDIRRFTELYHRQRDRAEAQNLAADPQYARVRAKLEREIAQHIERIRAAK